MRILLPLGAFDAPGAEGLYEAARAVPWEDWLTPQTTFAVEATLRDSEHTHSGFVALKIKDGIVDRLREKLGARPNVDTASPDYRVVAHLAAQRLSLSLDLCGEPLFKRGYRLAPSKASLKETLAAAIVVASGYTGEEPFSDPLAGSGTIAIEAALIATRRAPGLLRTFAFESWLAFRDRVAPLMDDARREAKAQIRPAPFPISASDYEDAAAASMKKNARAAGMGGVIRITTSDVLTAPAPGGDAGVIVSNPPYGERLESGGQKGMKSFYFRMSDALATWTGWRLALLAGNPGFESAFHRRPSGRLELWNGAIPCTLLQYQALRDR